MYSWVAKTEEIDILDEALDELCDQISKMQLSKNTIGIAYVYYDADFDELSKLINERIDFPVVGVSTIALLDNTGYVPYGIELLVLSGDDVEFEPVITDELNDNNFEEKIDISYKAIESKRADERAKLALAYITKGIGYSGDGYIRALDKITNGVPIFGGMASDMFLYSEFRIFHGLEIRNNGVLLILIYGNVKPITLAESSVSNLRKLGDNITKASGTNIYTLGEKSFRQVLSEEHLIADDEAGNVAMDFMQTPFMVSKQVDENESIDVIRNIIYLNIHDGSASFLGDVFDGDSICIGSLRSDDIGKSVNQAFEQVLRSINESKDYKYSTIICTSCTGRYINLVGKKDVEGNAYKDILPEDLSLVGMYSFGEICPKKSSITGKAYNFFHNETFTILAI